MITDAIPPAAIASMQALHFANSQLSALLPDYAIALWEDVAVPKPYFAKLDQYGTP